MKFIQDEIDLISNIPKFIIKIIKYCIQILYMIICEFSAGIHNNNVKRY